MRKIGAGTRFRTATAQLLASSRKSDAKKAHWYMQLYRTRSGTYFLRHSNPRGTRRFTEPISEGDAIEMYNTLRVKHEGLELATQHGGDRLMKVKQEQASERSCQC